MKLCNMANYMYVYIYIYNMYIICILYIYIYIYAYIYVYIYCIYILCKCIIYTFNDVPFKISLYFDLSQIFYGLTTLIKKR